MTTQANNLAPRIDPSDQSFYFLPSRVEGLSDVTEVEIAPTGLALKRNGEWIAIAFETLAPHDQPPWVSRLVKFLHVRPPLRAIGELSFDPTDYAKSCIRFITDPPITIFMPSDGPTRYPESHFWKIQQVLGMGGYRLVDRGRKESLRREIDRGPWWARTLASVLIFIAVGNVVLFGVVSHVLKGNTIFGKVEDGRYFLGNQRQQFSEVSQAVWAFSHWHLMSVIFTVVLALTGVSVLAVAKSTARLPRCRWRSF